MSSELTTNIDKVTTLIKEECQKENIDTSSFILSGAFNKCVIGYPSIVGVSKWNSFSISNREFFKPENSAYYSKLITIQNKIMDQTYDALNCELSLVPQISPGVTYLPIKSNRLENDEEVTLHLENGVSIIDFWAEWCGPCITAMEHNFKMIEKNFDQWNGKVKFFTTCRSKKEEKEDTVKSIEQNNWNRFPEVIQHFYRTNENTASATYGVRYIPFLIIIDQKGVIRHIGTIGDLDVEKFINELLEGKEFSAETAEAEGTNTQFDGEFVGKIEAFKDEATKLYEETRSGENSKANYNMAFRIEFGGKFDFNMQKGVVENLRLSTVKLTMKCRENEYDVFNNLLKKHFSQEEIDANKFQIERLETFNVEVAESNACTACLGTIAKEDLTYYCPECKIFFCAQCVNALKDKSGFEALIHREHYLLVFKNPNPENLKNLDKARLGKNLFAQKKEDELERHHPYCCNGAIGGCNNNNYNERYICMNCRPGSAWDQGYCDFCTPCFNSICESGPEAVRDDGHKNDHVYLQLIYSGKDYYEF